jgi:hypothetical protein
VDFEVNGQPYSDDFHPMELEHAQPRPEAGRMSRRDFALLILTAIVLVIKQAITILFLADGNARAARVTLYPKGWHE